MTQLEDIDNEWSVHPNSIFIQKRLGASKRYFLNQLGLDKFELITDKDEIANADDIYEKRYILVTEDEKWVHIIDNWFYTLYFNPSIKNRMKILSMDHNIFNYYMGDVDDVFSFTYYKKGNIVRDYEVDIRGHTEYFIKTNFGIPFPVEKIALAKEKVYDRLKSITKYLGIDTNYRKEKMSVYGVHERDFDIMKLVE